MRFKKVALAVSLALALGTASAQTYILENEYIRAGVNDTTGTLGSGGNMNPGIQYDNAGTSTFNPSYDYLTPGSPYEGWAVRIDNTDGTLYKLYGNNNAGFQMDGNTTVSGAWVGTPTASSAIWAGSVTEFDIKHTYSLPSAQRYLDITTRIDAKEAMPHLYFGRYIDPDAVAAPGDSSATDNVRGYGIIPKSNVVFSEATVSRYALGLYSAKPTGVNTSIQGWTSDPKNYYLNTNGYDVGNGDDTIGIAFYAANVARGDILTYNYAYIFGPSAFTAANYAITGGAGGGTAGTSSFGTLTDVGSATDAAANPTPTPTPTPTPPAVTVVGTAPGTPTVSTASSTGTATTTTADATLVNTRSGLESVLTTVNTVTTTTPVTVTTTTTPTIVTTYSDGTTSTASGTPVVTTATTNTVSVTETATTLREVIATTLPVITAKLAHHEASESTGKQTIARQTTTNVTTPIDKVTTVTVTTDGVVTSSNSSSVLVNNVDTSVANESFSGRIDQMNYLANLNKQIDRSLNMDAFRKDGATRDDVTMYINATGARSSMGDGYNAKSQIYGLGVEKAINPSWRLGAQYNRVHTAMDGTDSNTSQDKNHFGLFSVYSLDNDIKIVNNLGYVNNDVKSSRTVEQVFNNSHATTGNNLWLNNRVYAPDMAGFRPYVGATVGKSTTGGYEERGDIQSQRIVGQQNNNYTYGEGGVRYEKSIGDFRLAGDVGRTTDSITTGSVTVGYAPTKTGTIALTAATQQGDSINTKTLSLRGIIRF